MVAWHYSWVSAFRTIFIISFKRERLLDGEHGAEHCGVAEQVEALGLTATRHGDDSDTWCVGQQLDDHLDPVLLRHVQIGDHEIATIVAPDAGGLRLRLGPG